MKRNKTILVTGGCGYIGSITSIQLLTSGYDVVVLDDMRGSYPMMRSNLIKLATELGVENNLYLYTTLMPVNFTNLSKVMMTHEIDAIIHFAGYKSVPESVKDPLLYYNNNLTTTIDILSILKNWQGYLPLVFSSSASVYGDSKEFPITEESPREEPLSPYANTKRICEDLIKDSCKAYNLTAIALRYFNPIGAHPSGLLGESHSANNNLLTCITEFAEGKREKLEVYGNQYDTEDGTCERDFIDILDLADAHVAAIRKLLKSETSGYSVYNVGTGSPVSVMRMITTYEKVSGKTLDYKIVGNREGDIVRSYCTNDKITSELEWSPKRSLKDSIESAITWTKLQKNAEE